MKYQGECEGYKKVQVKVIEKQQNSKKNEKSKAY